MKHTDFDDAAQKLGSFTEDEIIQTLKNEYNKEYRKSYLKRTFIDTRMQHQTISFDEATQKYTYIGSMQKDIDQEKAFQFYTITKQQLEQQAHDKKIKNLSRYYKLTDYRDGSVINRYKGKAKILAQIAFHAQNGTMISSIVKFEENIDFLAGVLHNFDPAKVCEEFPNAASEEEKENSILNMVEKFKSGLKWNSSKSKNKDAIMRRYAGSLIEAAAFVNLFESREDFLKSLSDHYEENNYKGLIEYFNQHVKTGFSIALTCDFLKEFDIAFSSLPKPDVHIKDTLRAFLGFDEDYYKSKSDKKEYECIGIMQKLVEQINKKLSKEEQITVYQLDRMIWLVCSGNFFLDNTKGYKDRYLKALAEI